MALYRNRRLLNLAHRLKECQFRSPVCTGYQSHGLNPCHSNHGIHGHGMGIKSSDSQHFAGCNACHSYYDGGRCGDKALELFNAARARTFAAYRKNKWLDKVGYSETVSA